MKVKRQQSFVRVCVMSISGFLSKHNIVPKIAVLVFSLVILGTVIPFCTVPVRADEQKTVRIGCYDLKNFISQNADGTYSGYGTDYLDALCNYTGWKYQIVMAGNNDLSQMLADGTIDFLMPVSFSSDRLDSYAFTSYPIGEAINGLYVLKSRSDVYYDDYQTFNHMKIGVVENTYPATSLKKYAGDHGITYQEVTFPDLASLHQALEKGEVDAVSRSGLGDIPDDYHLVATTETVPFYIVSRADSSGSLYDELDDAINRINVEQPSLASNLHKKYLTETDFSQSENLTRQEAAYIQAHPTATVFALNDRYPISYKDPKTGQAAGILKDLLDKISANTGLKFTYSLASSTSPIANSLKDAKVDLAAGVIRTPGNRDNTSLRLSIGILSNLTGIVGNKKAVFDIDKAYTVAMPSSATGTIEHVKEYHPKYKIITYPSIETCLRAVKEGKVDAVMQNADILAAMLQHPEYQNLALWYTFSNEGEYDYCMASRSDADPCLISIINKGIRSLNENETEAIHIKYTTGTSYTMTPQDFLVTYGPGLAVICILAAVIATVLAYYTKSKRSHLAALEQAMAESRQANQAKTDFLSRMSHDIRTPMNGIIGMTYLAREEDNPPKTDDCLDKIETSSKFLLGLVNDILDMTKVEKNKLELHPEPYLMSGFSEYVDSVIRPLCVEKNQVLTVTLQSVENVVPLIDSLHFNQIVFNLLSNAVKYTPEGGSITLDVKNKALPDHKERIIATVADSGIGISDEFQKTLFDPFTQETRSDTAQNRGSGLGLAIVKKLVDLMGGTITVDSALGRGSTFTVTIDFDYIDGGQVAKTPAPAADPDQEQILRLKHVLLCEDHPLNQKVAKSLLEKKGMVVEIAENGERGVALFSESVSGYYSAVLMDIRMPVMDGYTAARAIRALDRPDAATVPIIAMTADAFADDVKKCLDAGMNGHIPKPIDPDNLYTTLAGVIQSDQAPDRT